MTFLRTQGLLLFVLMLGVPGLYSCGIKAQDLKAESIQKAEPRLLFLNYSISKDTNGQTMAKFINKIVSKGRLKDRSNIHHLTTPGSIECLQLDKNNKIIERSFLINPLKPIVEFVNDNGVLEKRQLDLQSAQLPIKLQLNKATKSVRLMLIDANGESTTTLITAIVQ